jgi:hypothetical protein
MGQVPLVQEVVAEWTLGGTFLRMVFRSITPDDNPTSGYEAVYHIGFNEAEQLFVMHLLDTTEVPTACVVGLGRREGNRIGFLFAYGETAFTNALSWQPERDTWRFLQTYEEDGETKTFATKEMTRVAA